MEVEEDREEEEQEEKEEEEEESYNDELCLAEIQSVALFRKAIMMKW